MEFLGGPFGLGTVLPMEIRSRLHGYVFVERRFVAHLSRICVRTATARINLLGVLWESLGVSWGCLGGRFGLGTILLVHVRSRLNFYMFLWCLTDSAI